MIHQAGSYENVYKDSLCGDMYVKNYDRFAHLKNDRVYSRDIHVDRAHKSATGATGSNSIQIESSMEETSAVEFPDQPTHHGRPPDEQDGEWRHCRGLDLRYFDSTTGSFDASAPLQMCLGDGDKF